VARRRPAAEACQAQFTEQSSDVRTRYLADTAAPGPAAAQACPAAAQACPAAAQAGPAAAQAA
jgi:hypothetical protein